MLTTVPLEPLPVTVVIQDQAGVSERALGRARKIARAIFSASGIDVRWSGAVTGCVRVVIVKHDLRGLPKGALGFATLPPPGGESYAVVSIPAVSRVAASEEVAFEIVLGAAIAHELGHVLLDSTAHSTSGVMSPRFTRREIQMAAAGRLLFSAAETKVLRAAVIARSARRTQR